MTTTKSALIVAPEANMAGLVAGMLHGLGYRQVAEVIDPPLAASAFARRAFDLVIIDDACTRPDAVDLVRRLRGDAAGPNRTTPVIMMAAAPDAARIAAARDAGVTEFLRKPFAAAHLKARLDGLVARPRDFVEAPDYAGPDRRRHLPGDQAPRRRSADDS